MNSVMFVKADLLRLGGVDSRNSFRDRSLATCVGTHVLRIPKLRIGNFSVVSRKLV